MKKRIGFGFCTLTLMLLNGQLLFAVNILQNPGFESGRFPWEIARVGPPIAGGSNGTLTIVSPGFSSGSAAKLTVLSIGTDPAVNFLTLRQGGLTLQPASVYRVRFTAYSTNGHAVTVGIGRHALFGVSIAVNLTTSWQTYTLEFVTKNFDVPIGPANVGDGVIIDLNVIPHAVVGDQYFFDNIELELVGPAPNLIVNGGFLTTFGWTHYRPGDESFSSVENSFGNNVDFDAKVAINNSRSNNLQLYQTNFQLRAGRRYRLSFDAASNDGRDLHVAVMKHSAPYTFYGFNTNVNLVAGEYRSYSFDFTAAGFSGSTVDTRLRFYFVNYAGPGTIYFFDNVRLWAIGSAKEGEEGEQLVPTSVILNQNYPNPFNPTTTISYALPKQSHVSLKVFNTLGQEVASLVDEVQDEGIQSVEFDAGRLASGVYLYRLTAGKFSETKKLMLVR